MLPPVRATLSSFVDYQTPSHQPTPRQRIDVANSAAATETIASSPLSGGRLDILSLSAQLQLAQGFSIFAETIGKLIKLPRREGEALLDYARRLSEAVKAMNPAERMALERILNQLVKGVSLRLLTEILNNPAGPDAARFAMRIETAQLLDRDLAAKAVVSSYRQNAGAEQTAAPPPRPANAAPPLSGQSTGSGTPPRTAAEAQAASSAPQTSSAAAANQAADTGSASITGPANNAEALLRAAATPEPDAETVPLTSTEETALQTAGSPETELPAAPAPEQEIAAELAESETPDGIGVPTDEMPEVPSSARRFEGDARRSAYPASGDRQISSPVFYDGPALARLSQRGIERAALHGDKTAAGAMTELLAKVFAEGAGEIMEALPAAARPLPERQALEELLDGEMPPEPALRAKEDAAGTTSKPAAQAAAEPETSAPSARSSGAPANPNGQPAGAAELGEQLALPLPLPHVLREGVPLPYVAYPPEERERDPEERKTKAISQTDEDGEQQHSADQHGFSEDQASGDEQEDAGEEASDEEAEDANRANDLYWRMAGWT
ncbi:hypothetical protein [Neorhizobium sp. DT-125]|uniref:hypothetical protein n=1 Tax=Neorhizobium sp. DT-125 TaxID=3396163 RepID=UPI003F1A1913